MHLAAAINPIQRLAGSQKATVAPVALVDEGITPGGTFDHRVEIVHATLSAAIAGRLDFHLERILLFRFVASKTIKSCLKYDMLWFGQ